MSRETADLGSKLACIPGSGFEETMDVAGVRLHVVRAGSGPDLLVIHGGPDWDHTYLRAYMGPLQDRAHTIFFDLRGCGRSQRFKDPSQLQVRYVVEDVRNLIARLDLARPAVLGFAFGGRVGLELLRRYPDLISHFILASSSAYPIGSSQKSFLPRGFPAAGRGNEMRHFALNSVERDVWLESEREQAREVIRRLRFSTQWLEAIRQGFPVADPARDYTGDLAASGVPTLVLHGEFDRRFAVTHAEALAKAVSGAKLCVLPNAAHFAHIDAPEAWNTAIGDFLKV